MHRWLLALTCVLLGIQICDRSFAADLTQKTTGIYAKENLIAWCIVPFDGNKRGPEERAKMLARIGVRKLAYDYRAEHIPTFDDEMQALKQHGIKLSAWWFPTTLNDEARLILSVLKKHDVKTELWVTGSGGPKTPDGQQAWVEAEANRIRLIAEAAAEIGCKVGLYNHGGWFGEPENQIAIIKQLGLPNVGIVYNLHHGHEHLDRLDELLKKMKPYLYAVNLNGMTRGGDRQGQKILPLGAGDLDQQLLRTIGESGYTGPVGILNHTQEDAEARLQDNLDGLAWLVGRIEGQPASIRPAYRSWQPPLPSALEGGRVFNGREEFRKPPITVECRATLRRKDTYNILIASDTKKSPAHWEIFTEPRSGNLCVYLPGVQPDHIRTKASICDDRPHHIAMVYESTRVRLFLDGRQVADQAVKSQGKPPVPGGLAVGRLVEGGLSCHGDIEWVRISTGARDIPSPPPVIVQPDKSTVELWTFPKPTHHPQPQSSTIPFNAKFAAHTAVTAQEQGSAQRGAALFADHKFACISCHKVGHHGGTVGPELTAIGKDRTAAQIAESLFWPQHEVKPEFVSLTVTTTKGKTIRGYQVRADEKELILRDPASGSQTTLPRKDIDEIIPSGSLMPEGLTAAMTRQQQWDVIRFLSGLGRDSQLTPDNSTSCSAMPTCICQQSSPTIARRCNLSFGPPGRHRSIVIACMISTQKRRTTSGNNHRFRRSCRNFPAWTEATWDIGVINPKRPGVTRVGTRRNWAVCRLAFFTAAACTFCAVSVCN